MSLLTRKLNLKQFDQRNSQNEDRKHKNSIFSNKEDHQQFISILKSINANKLIYDLNIPDDITKEIAEYAVGMIYNCQHTSCVNKIIVLKEDCLSKENQYYKC